MWNILVFLLFLIFFYSIHKHETHNLKHNIVCLYRHLYNVISISCFCVKKQFYMSWTGGAIQNLANHWLQVPDVLWMTYLIKSVCLSSTPNTDYSRSWQFGTILHQALNIVHKTTFLLHIICACPPIYIQCLPLVDTIKTKCRWSTFSTWLQSFWYNVKQSEQFKPLFCHHFIFKLCEIFLLNNCW